MNSAPFDDTPFKDAVVGDGSGTLFFTSGVAPAGQSYLAYVFDPLGRPLTSFSGTSADSGHPRALAQKSGFQMLEGPTQNFVRLSVYSPDGTLVGKTPVAPGDLLFGSIDPAGGSLVVSRQTLNPNRTLDYPWYITIQRFDAAGNPRAQPQTVASNETGLLALTNLGATRTSTGWTLIAWSTVDHTFANTADLYAAWVSPSGTVGAPARIAASAILPGGYFDVAPLTGGGAAIAASTPTLPIVNRWFANLRDGETGSTGPGWLDSYPMTRIAAVRGGRASAILAGAPILPPVPANEAECTPNISITLAAKDGKICGAVSLPVNISSVINCQGAISTAAVALDGSVVARTLRRYANPAEEVRSSKPMDSHTEAA